jgi:threonylcarbamoyladenosine tRNA methylthiotransferase MtaB
MSLRVFIETLGCRTNVADSSAIAGHLVGAGYRLVGDAADADIVLVNSCTVTLGADRDVGKTLRRARRASPDACLAVTGCLPRAQADHRVLADADLAIPGNDPAEILRQLSHVHPRFSREMGGATPSHPYETSRHLSRANIKIQEGCDGVCTYCIVPIARGAPRSRPEREILADVEAALDAGFQELVLTGTHLARYGRDRGEEEGLARLMATLERYRDDCRMRLSSLEPDSRLDGLLDRVGGSAFWCRHFHVALQHGSDRVLADMRRPYRFADVAGFVARAVAAVPDVNLGMDVIVGFPTEDDEAFAECFQRVRELPVSYLHVFAFSPRPGTPAAEWTPVAPVDAVKERSRQLRNWAAARRQAYARRFVGAPREVLVERRRAGDGGPQEPLLGLTDNYLQVRLDGPDTWMGTRRQVRLELDGRGRLRGDAHVVE